MMAPSSSPGGGPQETQPAWPEGVAAATRSILLVLDAGLLEAVAEPGLLPTWPGPRVLAVMPGHRIDRGQLRDVEDRMAVVEFLEAPSCIAHLIAALVRLGHSAPAVRANGLVYLNRAAGGAEMLDLASDLGARPDEVRLEREDGETRLLVLGPGLLTHPLMPTFMSLMEEWHVDDDLFCDLLRRKLLGAPA